RLAQSDDAPGCLRTAVAAAKKLQLSVNFDRHPGVRLTRNDAWRGRACHGRSRHLANQTSQNPGHLGPKAEGYRRAALAAWAMRMMVWPQMARSGRPVVFNWLSASAIMASARSMRRLVQRVSWRCIFGLRLK